MNSKCPYCGKKTFPFWKRIMAGGMASKGVACSECGRHAVHGMKSTVFRTVVSAVTLGVIALDMMEIKEGRGFLSKTECVVLFLGTLIIFGKLLNGMIFGLEENNRKDIK